MFSSKPVKGIFADHPPVTHDTELSDVKPVFQPFNNRDEGLDIGRVARPHLAAYRMSLVIKDNTHHHLV